MAVSAPFQLMYQLDLPVNYLPRTALLESLQVQK